MWTGSSYCNSIASLQFQPTKRPQLAAQKAKAKAIASKFAPPSASSTISAVPPPPPEDQAGRTPDPPGPTAQAAAPVKSTLADWTVDDDDINNFYGEKRERGGRKKRKKNRQTEEILQNWDDVYDPSRPNNYEEYKNSDEKIREVRDWKDVLYAHRMKRRDSSDYESDKSERKPINSKLPCSGLRIHLLTAFKDNSHRHPYHLHLHQVLMQRHLHRHSRLQKYQTILRARMPMLAACV